MASKNDITGDVLQSRMNSKEFEENFDLIFRSHLKAHKETHEQLSRIDTIGQNGNEGLHYEPDDGQLTDEQYAKIKEYEYELNKSTGDVEKRFTDGISKPNGEQFGNESDSTKS
jgi:hypothetical protein